MRVAFITSSATAGLTDDDRLALPPLSALGIHVEPVVWGRGAESFRAFDLVVLRSPWDWYERGPEFLAWLRSLDTSEVRLANRGCSSMLDKTYLRRLESNGARIVPTEWIAQGEEPSLASRMAKRGWKKAVIKPSLSANADRARVVSGSEDDFARSILSTSAVMLQPFFEEVGKGGEWSLVFLGGRFSHALRKVAAAGDFRVQTDYGGSVIAEPHPPSAVIEQAERALAATGETWLYARVDGVVRDRELYLMELEVVEPELFWRLDPAAPGRFARAIEESIRGQGRNTEHGP